MVSGWAIAGVIILPAKKVFIIFDIIQGVEQNSSTFGDSNWSLDTQKLGGKRQRLFRAWSSCPTQVWIHQQLPSARPLNVPRKGTQMSILLKKEETKENWLKTSIWTNGNKLSTSFWRTVCGCFSSCGRELSASKQRRAAYRTYRRKGQMGLECCFGECQTFILVLQWGGQGAGTLLCPAAAFVSPRFWEGRAAVRSSISSCCSSHIKCLFFLFFSSSGSAWAGLEVVLKKALRKGKGKLWRKSFLLGSDLQALGSYSVQMAFSIRNHPLWRQGLGDTLCSFQLVPEIS